MTGHATFLRAGGHVESKGVEPAAGFAYQVRMEEPSPRGSRLALAGALAAALLIGGAGFLLGRDTTERPSTMVAPPIAASASKPAPAPPLLPRVLGRADLIALAAATADAVASGNDPGPEIAEADGRRFELRLPFGCNGPAEEGSNAAMRWRYDADEEVLRIHVAPVTWLTEDWWPGAAPAGIGAIEGFWITRPWTSSERCPEGRDRPAAVDVDPVALPGQTLALGQIFLVEDPRDAKRNDNIYDTVVRVSEDGFDPSDGFRLRISGRIVQTRGAGPVWCRQPAGPEQRPICIVGVVMDEISIENAASGQTLATWSVARHGAPED